MQSFSNMQCPQRWCSQYLHLVQFYVGSLHLAVASSQWKAEGWVLVASGCFSSSAWRNQAAEQVVGETRPELGGCCGSRRVGSPAKRWKPRSQPFPPLSLSPTLALQIGGVLASAGFSNSHLFFFIYSLLWITVGTWCATINRVILKGI